MKSIQQWSSLICLTSIICTIIELILPPGKMQKTMNMVIGLFMLCAAITYTKNLFNIKLDFNIINSDIISEKFGFVNDISSQIESIAQDNVKEIILNVLKQINVVPKKIEIFMDTNEDNCISIIKCKIFLNKEDLDLTDKVKNLIENKLKIETEVTVYQN